MNNKRNTLQKRIVSDIFCEMHNHPSAGMVYEEVQKQFPSISRATVYRLLAEAAEEGKIQRLKLTDANDRYDITVSKHYHVVCRLCGAVADVEADDRDADVLSDARGCEGFLLESCHVEFVGLCKTCQKNQLKNKE